MNRWIVILGGLLAVQLLVAVAVNLAGEDHGAFEPQETLLAFDKGAVDGLRIVDGANSVWLARRDGRWVLPEQGDFPADQGAVERLLDRLAGLEKGWPVAVTSGAAERFRVAEEAFERKLTLSAKDEVQATLYVGTSPGFRKVHVRPAGAEAVYAAAFNIWEVSAAPDDWIDKDILTLDEGEIERVEMAGFVLQRAEGAFELADLGEGELTQGDHARSLITKLAGLRIQSLLGNDAKPEYRQDQPALEVKVARKAGGVLGYRFSKPEDGSDYVLKRSDLGYYFKVAEYAVSPFAEATRDKLVQAQGKGAGDGDADARAAPPQPDAEQHPRAGS